VDGNGKIDSTAGLSLRVRIKVKAFPSGLKSLRENSARTAELSTPLSRIPVDSGLIGKDHAPLYGASHTWPSSKAVK
jgi:hypothetical protein